MYTSSDISMTIAGRQTAPHAARLIGSGLSRRPTEDSAAQLRGVCTPGRIRTGSPAPGSFALGPTATNFAIRSNQYQAGKGPCIYKTMQADDE